MNCPYCEKEMRQGSIPISGGKPVWCGENPDTGFFDEIKLSNWMQSIEAFYCSDCRQVIVPVPEIEDFFDKLDRKLDEVKEKFSAAKDDFVERRAEKQNQMEKHRRKEKDPWEM